MTSYRPSPYPMHHGTPRFILWMTVYALLIFGGAFSQQMILGAHFSRDYNIFNRMLNSTTYYPVYVASLLVFFTQYRTLSKNAFLQYPYLLYFLLALASIAWSTSPFTTAYSAFTYLLTLLSAIAIAARIPFDRFIRLASYTLLACALCSIVYIIFIPSLGVMDASQNDKFTKLAGLPQGVFRHKNQLAEVMAAALVCAYCVGSRIPRTARIALLASAGYCLVASNSAGKIFSLIAAALALAFWHMTRRLFRSRISAFLAMAFVIALLAILLPSLMPILLPFAGKDATLTGRIFLWNHALQLAWLHPYFGYGLGSIWDTPLGNVAELKANYPHAHNFWIELFLRLGAVGLIVTAFAILKSLWDLLTARTEQAPYFDFSLLVIVSALTRTSTEVSLLEGNDFTSFLFFVALAYHYQHIGDASAARRQQTASAPLPFKSAPHRPTPVMAHANGT